MKGCKRGAAPFDSIEKNEVQGKTMPHGDPFLGSHFIHGFTLCGGFYGGSPRGGRRGNGLGL